MKTNFLKTSLFAFAFSLAIVASFAFSPALNDAADDAPTTGYTQSFGSGNNDTCNANAYVCSNSGNPICTVNGSNAVGIFANKPIGSTVCNTFLRDTND